jgi:serine/threonine-protein kinase
MAPELCEGAKNALPSTDVFSFGVMAYEMLVGAVPFTESAAMIQLRGEKVIAAASIARKCPTLDGEVAALLDRCLAEDPAERPDAPTLAALLAREASRMSGQGTIASA